MGALAPAGVGRLAVVAVALVYLGGRLHLGWGVWWYFFLLLETRAIPVDGGRRGDRLVASAALLGHELHTPAEGRPRRDRGTPCARPAGNATRREPAGP